MVTTRAGTTTTLSHPRNWSHTPSRLTQLWLLISLPLVIWDTIYVLGRPLTMEGGSMHWPLWIPYRLYGEVDHVYGWKAFNAKVGFTGAQGFLNAIETAMYLYYVWICRTRSVATVTSGSVVNGTGHGNHTKALVGRDAGVAILVLWGAAVMTLSKTVLYWMCEYFSGYDNIGHNALRELIVLWIIPNGAWIVLPTYIVYAVGQEIVDGLAIASGGASIKEE